MSVACEKEAAVLEDSSRTQVLLKKKHTTGINRLQALEREAGTKTLERVKSVLLLTEQRNTDQLRPRGSSSGHKMH